jgi:hypothetical protein
MLIASTTVGWRGEDWVLVADMFAVLSCGEKMLLLLLLGGLNLFLAGGWH